MGIEDRHYAQNKFKEKTKGYNKLVDSQTNFWNTILIIIVITLIIVGWIMC